jgi:diguanylate cyclase (GGDEF)-like protein/PAS domain S-box-containing protein
MRDFIHGTLGDQYRDLGVAIFDGTGQAPDALLHDNTVENQDGTAHAPLFQSTTALTLYGHAWNVRVSSLPAFEQRMDRQKPLLILAGGILATILATVASLALIISRERSSALNLANRELVSAITEQQTASTALSLAKSETQRILESITDAFFVLDDGWRFTYLNPKAEEFLRRSSADLLHRNIWDEFPEAVDTGIYHQCHRALREQKTVEFVEYYAPLRTWLDIRAYPHASGISVFFRDISRRVQQDEALRLRERAIESSVNAILITDYQQVDHPIIYANPAFERITGYTIAEALGQNCRFLQGNDCDQPDLKKLRALIREQAEGRVVLRNYNKSGDLFWNELYVAPVRDHNNRVTHFVGVLNDITETRNYQNELERRATHDLLTGLANRGLLMDRLQLAAIQAKRRGQKVAVLFIDLDGFKMINDGFGHATGDQVLKLTGNRLAASVREGDTVGRLGGDEFVIVLNDQERIEDISDAVTRIMESVLRPIPIQNHEIALTCSIGISVCPDDGEEAGALLKYADIAMYKAKEEGKNASRFYTRGMNDTIVQKITLTNNLRRALERREFLLHYQPQVDLRTGAVLGAEALIRWQHPEFGLISPSQFIPLAEESGQIVQVGEWVINTACAQGVAFGKAGLPPLLMSVNLSARQLRDKNLIGLIRNALETSGLPAQSLELEITESIVMADLEGGLDILKKIKDLGVHLAIDDFGTGYSSLSYLKRFPIDRLKIDKSFVRDVTTDSDDAALTTAIIALAHNLGVKVVAEGVETREQRDFLTNAGCDQAQGFFYAQPGNAGEFQRLIGALHRPR